MSNSRRPRSALLGELDKSFEDREQLQEPEDLRLDPSSELSQDYLAPCYCPILAWFSRGDRRRCGDVDCGRCPHLEEYYGEDDFIWVCSTCTKSLEIHPYWADGACAICGFESSILLLGLP